MTQDEKIKRLKALKARCERLTVSSDRGPEEWRKDAGALDLALSALRPISREQVEKMRGEMLYDTSDWNGSWIAKCSRCNATIGMGNKGDYNIAKKYRFCPMCMSPLTDEAVDMMIKRMEEMTNEH